MNTDEQALLYLLITIFEIVVGTIIINVVAGILVGALITIVIFMGVNIVP